VWCTRPLGVVLSGAGDVHVSAFHESELSSSPAAIRTVEIEPDNTAHNHQHLSGRDRRLYTFRPPLLLPRFFAHLRVWAQRDPSRPSLINSTRRVILIRPSSTTFELYPHAMPYKLSATLTAHSQDVRLAPFVRPIWAADAHRRFGRSRRRRTISFSPARATKRRSHGRETATAAGSPAQHSARPRASSARSPTSLPLRMRLKVRAQIQQYDHALTARGRLRDRRWPGRDHQHLLPGVHPLGARSCPCRSYAERMRPRRRT
jgi:hypothetical protein